MNLKNQNKSELTDEQKQTDLMQMIKVDSQEINDCLQFLGMDKDKWEKMWGNPKETVKKS